MFGFEFYVSIKVVEEAKKKQQQHRAENNWNPDREEKTTKRNSKNNWGCFYRSTECYRTHSNFFRLSPDLCALALSFDKNHWSVVCAFNNNSTFRIIRFLSIWHSFFLYVYLTKKNLCVFKRFLAPIKVAFTLNLYLCTVCVRFSVSL